MTPCRRNEAVCLGQCEENLQKIKDAKRIEYPLHAVFGTAIDPGLSVFLFLLLTMLRRGFARGVSSHSHGVDFFLK